MAEDAAVPAAKLQKAMAGDVTNSKALGTTAQPGTINLAPEDTAADPITGVTEPEGVASRIPIGGKKRKVALYIAYIGAGYYVSVLQLHYATPDTRCFSTTLVPVPNMIAVCL